MTFIFKKQCLNLQANVRKVIARSHWSYQCTWCSSSLLPSSVVFFFSFKLIFSFFFLAISLPHGDPNFAIIYEAILREIISKLYKSPKVYRIITALGGNKIESSVFHKVIWSPVILVRNDNSHGCDGDHVANTFHSKFPMETILLNSGCELMEW